MRIEEQHTFAAPFDGVWAMFADPASHVAKYERMGHREIEAIENTVDDDRARVVVRRSVDVDLPGFARKVMSPTNTVTTTDEWRRTGPTSAEGTQQVDIGGAPVRVSATTALRAADDDTTYEVAIEVEVKVPLIGGRLAKWAAGTAREQLAAEFAAGDEWLAGH